MSKIFISSRMQEMAWERKVVVETIHFAGHTPLYFEREPRAEDVKAKLVMDELIERSDVLLQMYYLSLGVPQEHLGGQTPLWYEFNQFFKKKSPHKPFILLRKIPPPGVSVSGDLEEVIKLLSARAGVCVHEFRTEDELTHLVLEYIRELHLPQDELCHRHGLIIRYSGPDYIGLIEVLSDVIFHRLLLNIDHIAHAARGGLATIYVACSPREELGNPPNEYRDMVKEELLLRLKADIDSAINERRHVIEPERSPTLSPTIAVDFEVMLPEAYKYYLEVRHIDSPGQVNAITYVLKDLQFNIDDLQLLPAGQGHERQKILRMWVSKFRSEREEYDLNEDNEQLLILEGELRKLIGVRSVSVQKT